MEKFVVPDKYHKDSYNSHKNQDKSFISETLITPESFAEVFCDDLDLPANSFVPAVATAIQQQIKQNSSESELNLEDVRDQRVIIKVCFKFYLFFTLS